LTAPDWPTVRSSHLISLTLLALLYTLLNCPKPLTIDDAAYFYYAAQIAQHPFDPYGFEMFWWQWPEPANHVLAPPVLPYWWAVAIRLFGQHTFLWKLWLLPFSLLFVFSLYALARRFARGLEMPLVWMTVLSPTFLPSLNLMLDVPALALSLCALVVFLRACDRQSPWRAMLAGLIAGLAIETKYTGLLAPAAMCLYALLSRKFTLWLTVTVGWTLLLFVSWEALIAIKYEGESHFLYAASGQGLTPGERLKYFTVPLLVLVGGVAPAVGLLGLAALGRGWRTISLVGAAVVVGYVLLACTDTAIHIPRPVYELILSPPCPEPVTVSLEQVVYILMGAMTCRVLGEVCWRLGRHAHGGGEPGRWRAHRDTWFLLAWLGLEEAGYFALTNFAAVRRVMGIVVVLTLIAGHLASRVCRSPGQVALVRGIAVGGALLGLAFWGVDFCDAWAEMHAVEVAAGEVREQERESATRVRGEHLATISVSPGAGLPATVPWAELYLSGRKPTVWYVGHWGFQHYAERAGMVPVVPDQSQFLAGDWLVKPAWPSPGITQQVMVPPNADKADLLPVSPELTAADRLPLRTIMCYYADGGGVPLEHHAGPRVPVTIYHIKTSFIPSSSPPAR
jgi:hypothetical protein